MTNEEKITDDFVKEKNLEKLEYIRNDKFHEYGDKIPDLILEKAERIINQITKNQPNLFPTPDGMIQLEFYNCKNQYMQFVIGEQFVEYYFTDDVNYDNDKLDVFEYNCDKMIAIIDDFFDQAKEAAR